EEIVFAGDEEPHEPERCDHFVVLTENAAAERWFAEQGIIPPGPAPYLVERVRCAPSWSSPACTRRTTSPAWWPRCRPRGSPTCWWSTTVRVRHTPTSSRPSPPARGAPCGPAGRTSAGVLLSRPPCGAAGSGRR